MILKLQDVKELNNKGNVIPLFKKISADLDTPVAAYIKIAKNKKHSFLLESIEGGEKLARYSFIGCDPFLTVEGWNDKILLKQAAKQKEIEAEPHEFLKELFSYYKPIKIEGLPRFIGGAVGYFSYDSIRWIEDIPNNNLDSLHLPEMRFSLFKTIIAFDHLKQEIVIISNILHDKTEKGLSVKYKQTVAEIEKIEAALGKSPSQVKKQKHAKAKLQAEYTEKDFISMVRKAKRYIKEGDIFQVVLSQRWQVKSKRSPLTVYRRLRRLNPSPYMFLLKQGDEAIIGSSPEMMVRIEQGSIETRPIAGTRPRGKDDAEDNRRIEELMADKKELAEHTMLLDLGRNDIGRVAKPGTVRIKENMIIEKYSHVIHIVSSVTGAMVKEAKPIDGFFACFPAGTVSGAPKIRAMEIIDELEKTKRSVYAGAIAYLDFWGNLDSCIAIRTVVHKKGRYFIQAGAGIVADSKPKKEFLETEAKAKVLVEAITGDDI